MNAIQFVTEPGPSAIARRDLDRQIQESETALMYFAFSLLNPIDLRVPRAGSSLDGFACLYADKAIAGSGNGSVCRLINVRN